MHHRPDCYLIAGILALFFLLGMLLSGLVFVFNLRSSIKIPTYQQIAAKTADDNSGVSVTSGLDQRRDLEKKFGDRLAKIIRIHKLDENPNGLGLCRDRGGRRGRAMRKIFADVSPCHLALRQVISGMGPVRQRGPAIA